MEQEIQSIIGSELALNVAEQYGLVQAMSLPQDDWALFLQLTDEVRLTW